MFINNFDPVAFNIFSLEIRWYSLSYIFGIIFGWLYCKKILIKNNSFQKLFDDYIFYIIIGIILGGRLGYVVIYNLSYYFANPLEILMIWQGGMSFHGAVVGVILLTYIFSIKTKTNEYGILLYQTWLIILGFVHIHQNYQHMPQGDKRHQIET